MIKDFIAKKDEIFRNRNLSFLWLFQLFSLFGSELTRFALPIWLFQQDENLISFSTYMFSGMLPRMFSPLFGGLIDCFSKKKLLLFSALFSLITCLMLALTMTGFIQNNPFLICFIMFSFGVWGNLIHIGTLSCISQIVEKEHLVKANSFMIATDSSAALLCPFLSGSLIFANGFSFVVSLDMFLLTLSLIFLMKLDIFSKNKSYVNVKTVIADIKKSLMEGASFIIKNRQLLSLILIFGSINFFFSFSFVLFSPMILSSSNNNIQLLGTILSVGSGIQLITSFLAGCYLRSCSEIIMKLIMLMGLFGPFVIGAGFSPIFWTIGYAATLAFLSIINAANNAFWQETSPEHLQGSIFGIRRMISSMIAPIGILLAGPLMTLLSTSQSDGYRLVFILSGSCIFFTGFFGLFLLKPKAINLTSC